MDTIDTIKKIIAEDLKISIENVTENTEIGGLDGWDSLHNVQILFSIEKQFSIKLSPDQIIDLETVGDIAELVGGLTT